MKITIHNFRCHTDRSIEFPDTGLVLLSGSSGSGKTSILNALVYTLYGCVKKPCHLEKKNCSVTLDMLLPGEARERLHVNRSSPGNRLVATLGGTT